MNYERLTPVLEKAIQELKATTDEHQNKISNLKAENSSFKKNSSDIEDLKKKYDELIKMLSISAEKK
jgi:predicted nuclease with TOPRIM domain